MTGLLNWITQVTAVTWMNLRSLSQRKGASLAAAVGVAGVVAVLVSVLSIAEGFQATLETTGSEETVIVMRGGTDTEMNSILPLEHTRIIADAPRILRGASGPVASAELFVIVDIPKISTGTDANVPLRGVQPAAYEVRPRVQIVEGRRFEPGRNEIIVGVGAVGQFAGLEVGKTLRWGETEWTIVGLFATGGTVYESEIWCDAFVLQPAYRRGNTFQSVYARLDSAEAFEEFKDALTTDPRLDVKVQRESEYLTDQAATLNGIVNGLGFLIAGLMGIGAVFGAVNTMYSAVSARTREIATLRALGFSPAPVVVSILVESLLLALAGGLIGGLCAYLAFNGYQAATLNWDSFAQVAFSFRVTPRLLLMGTGLALLMGMLGGILPAIRASRIPVATALREL